MQTLMFPRPPATPNISTGSLSVYWNLNPLQTVSLDENITTLLFAADPPYPCPLWLAFIQDAGGGHTVDWSGVTNLSGTEPVVSPDPDTTTVVQLFWDGTNYNV